MARNFETTHSTAHTSFHTSFLQDSTPQHRAPPKARQALIRAARLPALRHALRALHPGGGRRVLHRRLTLLRRPSGTKTKTSPTGRGGLVRRVDWRVLQAVSPKRRWAVRRWELLRLLRLGTGARREDAGGPRAEERRREIGGEKTV